MRLQPAVSLPHRREYIYQPLRRACANQTKHKIYKSSSSTLPSTTQSIQFFLSVAEWSIPRECSCLNEVFPILRAFLPFSTPRRVRTQKILAPALSNLSYRRLYTQARRQRSSALTEGTRMGDAHTNHTSSMEGKWNGHNSDVCNISEQVSHKIKYLGLDYYVRSRRINFYIPGRYSVHQRLRFTERTDGLCALYQFFKIGVNRILPMPFDQHVMRSQR